MQVLESVEGKRRAVIEHARWLKALTDGTCLLFLFFSVVLVFLFISGRRQVDNGKGSDLDGDERADDGSNGLDTIDGGH